MTLLDIKIEDVLSIARKAGERIMAIYGQSDFHVETKSDHSPLTLADTTSHEIIKQELQKLYPEIPLLSEEGKSVPFKTRKQWPLFWLVDPLDGTKEFINRNGEFTVNIALIEKQQPVLGVMAAPVLDTLYYGKKGVGAFKQTENHSPVQIRVNQNAENGLIAVKSRSHASHEEEIFFSQHPVSDSISVGSALKFCMVAEGKAHLYYRHGPTWEWDTAAGHFIAECAGASVYNLTYNKKNLLNAHFLVSSVQEIQLPR
jgi:3'(2'), 5'-bisphosphate nucleotidase